MARRTLTLLLPLVLLSAGCSEAQRVQDCAALASDVARAGLSGVPTQAEAADAARQLDQRVSSLDSEEVRGAAATLRDRLRELQQAARSADPSAVRQAAERARQAARDAAETCGVPADQFLG